MATDLSHKESSSTTRIVGSDELYAADVIEEDGLKKLVVKASVTPTITEELLFEKLVDGGGSADLTVNGSSIPVEFSIEAGTTDIKVVRELKFSWFDNGVKIDTFLGQNAALTNGLEIEFLFDGVTTPIFPIKTTADFNGHFAFGDGSRFETITGSGNDYVTATLSPREPFVLRPGTTDKITIRINDNLNNVSFGECIAFGLIEEV